MDDVIFKALKQKMLPENTTVAQYLKVLELDKEADLGLFVTEVSPSVVKHVGEIEESSKIPENLDLETVSDILEASNRQAVVKNNRFKAFEKFVAIFDDSEEVSACVNTATERQVMELYQHFLSARQEP